MYSIIASVAIMATSALAQSVGSAVVVNACSYDVYLCNVPAADGGYTEIDQTLSPNDTYSQQFTELTNSDGWSLKLSKTTELDTIMQYEYTFHNDGIIWYDLSDVNGNPWDGDWEITASSASGTCTPKQQAYRYATDDAYGMQACPQDSVITVTLCSGEDTDDSAAASVSSSVAAVSSSVATETSTSVFTTPTSSAPAAYTSATSTESSYSDAATASLTTFATSTYASTSSVVTTAPDGVTVTDVATAVVTDVVTQTYWHGHQWSARHEHRRHGHA